MNVAHKPLISGQPLAEALIRDFPSVGHLYESNPLDKGEWSKRCMWLDSSEHLRVQRAALVSRLREYNLVHNPNEAVMESLNKLEQPGTTVIVGGQQSGLFSGPLLVIYKAVSIIKAAEHTSTVLGRPVVPVFWIAGEDHDWDEVNHTYLLSSDMQISRIRVLKEEEKRSPVSMTDVNQEDWKTAIDELECLLPDSEFKIGLMEHLRQIAADSSTLSEGFAKLMGTWFGKYGLVLLDSADPYLRKLEVPVFQTIINRNDELEAAYKTAAEDIVRLGGTPQADVADGGANLFYIHEGERLLLFKRDGHFADRKGKISFTKEELLSELTSHPERFSNNVLTRPLMQDSLLPVLGSVLGAGEIAYWGLTRRAFDLLGLKMPILLPRMSFTVVEGTLQKQMEKYKLTWEDVKDRDIFRNKRESWLVAQDKVQLDSRFDEIKSTFGGLYEPLIDELGGIQNGLLKLGNANKDKILDQIEYLRGRAKDALEKANEVGLRHFERIELSLFPQHKPQERVYNVFYYLNRYGMEWIDDLMEIPYDIEGNHRVIYL
ncbi:bacillithiol biosynthesis cysteine-adding enzyme BshC [Paenibacillus segetis]|uniref:Putative cysteine ligase BshC n=1 Tax=Paenibacillus segetis TaxID=1325360 RepID=A0ABQ1YJ08_9BACL|nr:bacillithiol biosynthesis cysteine-adding enzyme BshC [Paenibacillus segetis]GGH26418.1 putative cysteine ligase BshC [Paenibacillus segetis]